MTVPLIKPSLAAVTPDAAQVVQAPKTFYCYSADNVTFEGKFEDVEDAKLAFILRYRPELDTIYYVGEVIEYTSRNFISVLSLVDQIRAQAIFEVKDEEKVGRWPDISPSKYHELREYLVKFFDENYPVNFSGVENVKSYIVGE